MNVRDEEGFTSLHQAAGDSTTLEIVTALLEAGANVNARTGDGSTPLHRAAAYSKTPAIVTALLDAGADPAARDNQGKTPSDWVKADSPLKGTEVYWRLNEGRFR